MPTGEPAGSIPNVGLFRAAIKGCAMDRRHCERSEAIQQQVGLFLEQLVRRAAMTSRVGHMCLDALDLAFECFDPRRELVDREGTEILLYEQRQRILWLAGKEVVVIHGRQNR